MIYRRTERFRKAYQTLPKHIQEKVSKAFALFQENPRHPSLGVKKVQGLDNIWEGRIDLFYRFTFEYVTEQDSEEIICLFRNIGPHNIIEEAP
jgi:mRNA interferase RelE/StbE